MIIDTEITIMTSMININMIKIVAKIVHQFNKQATEITIWREFRFRSMVIETINDRDMAIIRRGTIIINKAETMRKNMKKDLRVDRI